MKCVAYARLEASNGRVHYECLEDHLANVAIASLRLAGRLARGLSRNVLEALVIAAALHDIGKVLHYVAQRRFANRLVSGEVEGRLTFVYHEVLSTALLGVYAWDFNEPEENVASIASRAIAMHHQGLRGVSAHVYSEGIAKLADIYAKLNRDEIVQLHECIARVLEETAKRLQANLGDTPATTLLTNIAKAVHIGIITVERALNEASTLLPEWVKISPQKAEEARIATGILMLADSAVARQAAGETREASRYIKEAVWLYRTFVKAT